MSVKLIQPAINLRDKIAGIFKPKYTEKLVGTFLVGVTAQTSFDVPENHEPFQVFDAGVLMKEGSGDDYTITDNGMYKTVEFSVAPTNLNDVTIYSYVRI